jgi:hypothetical protein
MILNKSITKSRPWAESIGTILTCVIVGPPIGGIVASLFVTLPGLFFSNAASSAESMYEKIIVVLVAALFCIPFSYWFGGLAALISGFLMTAYGWTSGRPSLWFALVVAVGQFSFSRLYPSDEFRDPATVMFAVYVSSALVCWLVVRNFWRVTT